MKLTPKLEIARIIYENNKIKLINEIKTLDKNKMFTPKPKKSFFEKLSIVLGFGKKR